MATILISVIRTNSKIGKDNRWTIPLDTQKLKQNSKAKFKLYAFDPFNEKFEDIKIRLTTAKDWSDRSVSEKWFERATEFTRRCKWHDFR
ncbi:hypothetical protein ADICYQ_3821 [Cyclobacterium qasimii M12-11B]|uniref:Uncharacterized protein n=1 Tax=Cyclobacterium qasimii M12-11B TaxID=641524 RepID=S7VBC1_9BACT|nr:hypothetical protein ADICYQ_3821 [Cyclobacterium qasimii M12-11B]